MKTKISTLFLAILLSLASLNAQTAYNYYFGNIHSQTSYSDGNKDATTSLMTTPLQAFNYAKQSQHIDFYGVSDHNHASAGMSSLADWHSGITDANTANSDGSFVALYGQEWGVISGGGHVVIYGYDSLMGWDAGLYDVFVAQSDYTTLFNKITARSGAFAYLAHPQATDYSNLLSTYSANADQAVIGMAARSGPAFSTNSTYSDPATSDYIARYNDALKMGYHVGIGLDHDTHYSVFGRQTAGRLVVLASSLTRANILDAFLKMRIYSSDDWNTKIDFNISSQPMGSVFSHTGSPTIKVTVTDPDAEAVSTIQIYYGVPGSGTACTVLGSNSGSSTYTIAPTIANNSTYYYYAKITQADGDVIWTSPIWYTRNDNATTIPTAVFSTSSNTVCVGQVVNLTDNSTNSPSSWNWTMTSGTPTSSTLENPTVTYNVAGTYTVTLIATNSGGGSTPVSKVITVKANPNVTSTNSTICQGQSATITASNASTYSWNTGATTSSISVNPSSTTVYTVTGTSNGCSKIITSTVTVNSLPNVSANSATICNGQSATIAASNASTYSWNTGATTSAISVNPSSTTVYTVTGTSNGCSKTIATTVTVNSLPNVSASTSQNSLCSGQSAILTASGASSYTWSANSGSVTTTTVSVLPVTNTTYTVTGSNGNCKATSIISITVNANPATPIVTQNGGVLTSNSTTGNQWYLNGVLIPSATNQTYTVTQNGNYTVIVTSNGCASNTSAIYSFSTTGILAMSNETQMTLYPNPNNGNFELVLDLQKTDNYTIEIINTLGQFIYSEKLDSFSGHYAKHIDISQYGSALYYFILRGGNNQIIKKVIVN